MEDKIISATCETCLFQKKNICHRYPPKRVITPENIISTWDGDFKGIECEYSYEQPNVYDSDWCGEYRDKEERFPEKTHREMREHVKRLHEAKQAEEEETLK